MRKVRGWFAGKQAAPTDRLTRASTSSPSVRISYNDDVEHPTLLHKTNAVQAMSYPCFDFLDAAGLREHFTNFCENAGLAYLITHEVQ